MNGRCQTSGLNMFFDDPSPELGIGLLAANSLTCFDGIQMCGDAVRRFLNVLPSLFITREFMIEHRSHHLSQHAVAWSAVRQCTAAAHDSIAGTTLAIRGITSFQTQHQMISEIREYSDTALHYPGYHQLLSDIATAE